MTQDTTPDTTQGVAAPNVADVDEAMRDVVDP